MCACLSERRAEICHGPVRGEAELVTGQETLSFLSDSSHPVPRRSSWMLVVAKHGPASTFPDQQCWSRTLISSAHTADAALAHQLFDLNPVRSACTGA